MKTKYKLIISVVFAFMLISAVYVIAKTVNINKDVEIPNEITDYYENLGLNVANETVNKGVQQLVNDAEDYFKNEVRMGCDEVIWTGNITKMELLKDEIDEILRR